MAAGRPMSALAWSMALTASPSDTPGARLNDTVTAETCPWGLMAGGVVEVPAVGSSRGGRGPPAAALAGVDPPGAELPPAPPPAPVEPPAVWRGGTVPG